MLRSCKLPIKTCFSCVFSHVIGDFISAFCLFVFTGERMLKAKEGIQYSRGEDQSTSSLKRKFDEFCSLPKVPYEENPFFTCVERAGLFPVKSSIIHCNWLIHKKIEWKYHIFTEQRTDGLRNFDQFPKKEEKRKREKNRPVFKICAPA